MDTSLSSSQFDINEREIMRVLLRQHLSWAARQSATPNVLRLEAAARSALVKVEAASRG